MSKKQISLLLFFVRDETSDDSSHDDNAELPTHELSKPGHNAYSSVEVISWSFDCHNAKGKEGYCPVLCSQL